MAALLLSRLNDIQHTVNLTIQCELMKYLVKHTLPMLIKVLQFYVLMKYLVTLLPPLLQLL